MVVAEAERTLVKSPPELWSELSDPAALARHLGELGEIRIVKTDPEQCVEWEAEDTHGKVQITPSGWGTKVSLSVSIDTAPADTPVPQSPVPHTPAAAPAEHPVSVLQAAARPVLLPKASTPDTARPEAVSADAASEDAVSAAPTVEGTAPTEPSPAKPASAEPEQEDAAPADAEPASKRREPDTQASAVEQGERTVPTRRFRRLLLRVRLLASGGRGSRANGAGADRDASSSRATGTERGPTESNARQHERGLPARHSAVPKPKPASELAPQPPQEAVQPPQELVQMPRNAVQLPQNAVQRPEQEPKQRAARELEISRAREKDHEPPSDRTPTPGTHARDHAPPLSRARERDHDSDAREASHSSEVARDDAQGQVERTTELLSAMLDSLGEAHHRPFSRS